MIVKSFLRYFHLSEYYKFSNLTFFKKTNSYKAKPNTNKPDWKVCSARSSVQGATKRYH